MSLIRSVSADLIYDSRGHPTIEAEVRLDSGARGHAGAPSGASTGIHEVQAFPAGGVAEAVSTVRLALIPRLLGIDAADRAAVDGVIHSVDGTANFSRLGGNSATAVSMAAALAYAAERGQPLWRILARPGVDGRTFPAIVGNCLNGGKHAIGGPDIQEFIAFAEDPSPDRSVAAALRVHSLIGAELHRRYPTVALGRGDEGGWVARVGNVEALEILTAACATARDELKVEVHPGLDLAASEFYSDGKYRYQDRTLDPEGQVAFVAELVDRYGLRYLEDPIEQDSFAGFAAVTKAVGDRTLVIGDDIYVTRASRLATGIEQHSTNAVLIKVNQVGTLTETLRTVDLARASGQATITSHRSGEVPEGWLAHVAVGTGARGLKCGLLGGERVAKLNELLRLGRATGR
ncbi:MAG: phosphopyruvate hydratase [Thermoplasmata archaeon]